MILKKEADLEERKEGNICYLHFHSGVGDRKEILYIQKTLVVEP